MKTIKIIMLTILLLVPQILSAGTDYIPASDPTRPIVGNWARVYEVSTENGNAFNEMEIFSFHPDNKISIYYYEEGSKRPFVKLFGHYAFANPFILIDTYKKGEYRPHNLVWKDCAFFEGTMSCTGYHDPSVPFKRWETRPNKLEAECCDLNP